jgi:hypothetical protein
MEALALMVPLMPELSFSSVELFVGFACAAVATPPQDAAAKKKQVTSSNKYRLMPVIWFLSI